MCAEEGIVRSYTVFLKSLPMLAGRDGLVCPAEAEGQGGNEERHGKKCNGGLYFWGISRGGHVYDILENIGIEVAGFVDNSGKKWGHCSAVSWCMPRKF